MKDDHTTKSSFHTSGILSAIAEPEEYKEQVIKGKTQGGSNALVVLHAQLDHGGDLACCSSAQILRLVAEDPAVRPLS